MSQTGRLAPLPAIGMPNRLRRALWQVTWALLYRPTPVFAHAWRAFLLRAFGATVELPVYPYPSARIWAPWNLVMRRGSCIAAEVDCYNVARVTLGNRVTVSQKSYICTASHDFDAPAFTLIGGSIEIGADAWVAADAFIGPSVTIADSAVVLARSVVVRDVSAGTVVGGNPAKVLRARTAPRK